MPKLGALNQGYSASAPDGCRKFAGMLRQVHRRHKLDSLQEQAHSIHVAKPTLSRYLNAVTVPEANTVAAYYKAAREHQELQGSAMPFSLEEIEAARAAARAAKAQRRSPVRAEAGAGAAPVPSPPRADHAASTPTWAAADEVETHLKAGRLQRGHQLLAAAGRNLTPPKLLSAIVTLRLRGLDAAADTLLLQAGRRGDRDRFAILAELNSAGRSTDIAIMLRAVTGLVEVAA